MKCLLKCVLNVNEGLKKGFLKFYVIRGFKVLDVLEFDCIYYMVKSNI